MDESTEPTASAASPASNYPPPISAPEAIQRLEMPNTSDEERRRRQRSLSASPRRSSEPQAERGGLSERHRLQVLHAMGQSVHVSDPEGRIIYWNRLAEHLYGFSAAEALGQKVSKLIVDQSNIDLAVDIERWVIKYGRWSGKLLVKNKRGERFMAMVTKTLFCDEMNGKFIGIICVSSDSRSFLESKLPNLITDFASKSRTKDVQGNVEREHECSDVMSLDHRDDRASSGAHASKGDALAYPFPRTSSKSPKKASRVRTEETEGRSGFQRTSSIKAETWVSKKGMSWPLKSQEQDENDAKNRFSWPWLHHDAENDLSPSRNAELIMRLDIHALENTRVGNVEATGSWSSSVSSSGSTSSSAFQRLDLESDCLDYEILWEDLVIGEQIGQGSCGTVYHALWYGSDVAVKVFSKMEYSEEVISSFKQEVSLMKRLRHPNILLFMGSVTSPQRLCIVTEFLPRGSLFLLLQRATTKLDWRRRVNMALDIARGVNYLHHCNPPIFHRDLKSSNLLVDKNWTVKVGDFGLSRLKRETHLTSNTGKGTPQWMAPEVLRNEHADEKSDVYSYGVVLWELVTEKIPWDNLNSMQVIGAVGFMNKRLELPEDLDPHWVSIITSCWHSEPNLRPSFQELIERLKELQRHYSLQSQMLRSSHRKPPLERE